MNVRFVKQKTAIAEVKSSLLLQVEVVIARRVKCNARGDLTRKAK
jgi:hypothetical protein